jgi:hypothetical protein
MRFFASATMGWDRKADQPPGRGLAHGQLSGRRPDRARARFGGPDRFVDTLLAALPGPPGLRLAMEASLAKLSWLARSGERFRTRDLGRLAAMSAHP